MKKCGSFEICATAYWLVFYFPAQIHFLIGLRVKLMLSNVAPYQGAFALGMLADIWPVKMSLIPSKVEKIIFTIVPY